MIIALDPGITTGVAYLSDERIIHTDHIMPTHLNFTKYLASYAPTEIVYERFFYQRRNKVELYPVEVIGVIKLFAEQYDIPLYAQTASQAKGLFTDDKIKLMDLWVKGQVHGMDALRHLLYHMVITKGDRSWLNVLKLD